MKAITLRKPDKKDGIYLVYLGNQRKVEFTNILKCQKFVNETSVFLTGLMQKLNYLYGEIFLEYREAWIYFDSGKIESERKRDINNRIKKSLIEIDQAFDFVYQRSMFVDGYYMVWHNLQRINNKLINILRELIRLNEQRSYRSKIVKYEALIGILKLYGNDLERYPG